MARREEEARRAQGVEGQQEELPQVIDAWAETSDSRSSSRTPNAGRRIYLRTGAHNRATSTGARLIGSTDALERFAHGERLKALKSAGIWPKRAVIWGIYGGISGV